MVKVYATVLAVGLGALVALIMSSAFATNIGRDDRDANRWMGVQGRMVLGGFIGFGIGGISAEFSPLGLSWQVALAAAVVGAVAGALWVRFISNRDTEE